MPSAPVESAPSGALRAWTSALALGVSAFIFVTAEMLPVGILPDIALSLGRSEASTGLLMTVYAWGVALLGLPLTLLTARLGRKALLLALFAVFVCGNALSAAAATFAVLMAARICVAVSHSVFWAVTPPLALRVAPAHGRTKAMSIIVTGTSLATVLGVPLGTLLGHYFGWRCAFGAVAAAAFAVAALLWLRMPPVPASGAGNMRNVLGIVRHKALLRTYALTLLTATGQFAVFTYFAPFMQSVGGFDSRMTAALLLALGLSGLVGSIAGNRLIETPGRRTTVAPLAALSLLFAFMSLLARAAMPVLGLSIFLWGVLYTFLTMVLQLRVINLAPASADLATAIYSGSFNVGVGLGAFIGSRVFLSFGIAATPWAGAALLAIAAALALVRMNETTAEP